MAGARPCFIAPFLNVVSARAQGSQFRIPTGIVRHVSLSSRIIIAWSLGCEDVVSDERPCQHMMPGRYSLSVYVPKISVRDVVNG